MARLAALRPVYHSEADFQHAFAWELQKQLPTSSIFLERPQRTPEGSIYLDIFLRMGDQALAIELKYKTQKYQFETPTDFFRLSLHGASDLGRYDFLKDICRLERVAKAIPRCMGWAVFLTNDASYWSSQRRINTIDAAFSLAEGRALAGSLGWGTLASAGTMRSREATLELEGSYGVRWQDYSHDTAGKHGHFRYLPVIVDGGQ
jgi:hypothetical protein